MPRTYTDPTTGDTLTPTERLSWRAQSVIRRWRFIVAITVVTAVVWTYVAFRVGWGLHSGALALLTWWNLAASYLALLIESVVGIGMFSAQRRDQVVLREVRRIALHVEALLDHHDIERPVVPEPIAQGGHQP